MMRDKNNSRALAHTPTRRQVMVSAAVAFGGLAFVPARSWAGADDEISRTAESIHQEALFTASRNRVYEALTDAKQFDKIVQLSGVMQAMHLADKPSEIGRDAGASGGRPNRD